MKTGGHHGLRAILNVLQRFRCHVGRAGLAWRLAIRSNGPGRAAVIRSTTRARTGVLDQCRGTAEAATARLVQQEPRRQDPTVTAAFRVAARRHRRVVWSARSLGQPDRLPRCWTSASTWPRDGFPIGDGLALAIAGLEKDPEIPDYRTVLFPTGSPAPRRIFATSIPPGCSEARRRPSRAAAGRGRHGGPCVPARDRF